MTERGGMRKAFVVRLMMVSCMAMSATNVYAAKDVQQSLDEAQSSFDRMVLTLRDSVDQLSAENVRMAAANEQARKRVSELKDFLLALKKDEGRVLEKFTTLETRYRKKIAQVNEIDAQLAELMNELAGLDEYSVKLVAEVAQKQQQDAVFIRNIEIAEKALAKSRSAVSADLRPEVEKMTQQRDALKKRSTMALVSLQKAREEWLELRTATLPAPERIKALGQDRKELSVMIERKKASLEGLQAKIQQEEKAFSEATATGQVSEQSVDHLGKEVRALHSQYTALQKQLAKFEKEQDKRGRRIDEVLQREHKELEQRMTNAKSRNKALKEKIISMRRGMVDMDKRKAELERQVYSR